MSVSLARKSEMALSEAERQPNADADGEEGMLSEIVSSSNVVDGVDVSMGRVNVAGVSDISPEKNKEIKVSVMPDVPIQVLDDDSRFPDVVMKHENLEMNSYDSSIRNENIPERVSGGSGGGGELNAKRVESGGSHFDSKVSMFDEFSASGPSISSLGTVPSSVGHRYEVGDLVWGKVKSHPWWPGHIYNDMFASPAVRRNKRPGYFLVAFFGDSSYGWFASDELVPFEPNFEEKSQQTNSRNFVKAVEEAVEEISRRCAMGLSCKCRNTYKFHPTKVQGFVAVEVNQYDGGIYSMKQIEKARNLFQPQQILDHIKIAAQMPLDVDYHDINVIQRNATTSAYRKSVFEEFDETYAQAFGQNPIHHPPISLETTTQAAREPRAPLSGPLVIPEAMGKKKISAKLNKSKETNKDKYLLKRRDEPSEPNQQMQNSVLPPLSIERVSSVQTPVQKPSSSERENTDSKLKAKKAKVFKRPHSEINVEKKSVQMGEMKMKKKQKKMEMSSEPNKSEVVFTKTMQDASASGTQNLKLPELVRSLEALAKDPFYNSGIYSPKTVKDAFLRYRSQVYQKSSQVYQKTLADPSPSQSETDTSLNQRPMQPLISRPDTSLNQQPIQPLISRPDDPTRGGRKREASDRQEELSSKRLKKVNSLKTAITRPPPAKPAERPPRVREPTALVIKFPSNFSLPSSSELKARLARFGPLDQFGTRIFYKTHTCRVVFLFKSDAMAANKHLLGTSRLFGNVQVMCHIRDMSAQMLESEPNKTVTEDTSSIEPPPQQLKSCLKKPPSAADETTTTTGEVSKGKSRVKFLLGGEETSHVNIPNRKLAINGTISSSTLSSSGDFDSNTTTTTTTFINKPVSVSMLPPAASYAFPTTTHSPTISPFPNAPLFHNMQVNVVDNVSGSSKVDIAPQMLGLLARCSDVVATIRNHFGYIPYHSL